MSNKKITYNPGTMKPLLQLVTSLIKQNPKLLDDADYLRTALYESEPGLRKTENCFNCWASMAEYWFEFDCLDAVLLYQMGIVQRERLQKDDDFTKSNQIVVQDLPVSLSIKCRTTQASKLGLITQLKNGKKRVPGVWVITSRGFEALRDEPVPKRVKVWRGRIIERSDELITMSQAFRSHSDKVMASIARHKEPQSDYRDLMTNYDPNDWVHVAGMHAGSVDL